MALLTLPLAPDAPPLDDAVRDKHFERKHGPRRVLRPGVSAGEIEVVLADDAIERLPSRVQRPALVVMDLNTKTRRATGC